jgi:hypothetical protein
MPPPPIQSLTPAFRIGSIDVGKSRMTRPLLPKAAGALQGGFQETWLAQKVLGQGGVTG